MLRNHGLSLMRHAFVVCMASGMHDHRTQEVKP